MPKARKRLLIACAVIVILTTLVNLPIAATLLNAPLGLQWSDSIVKFLRTNTQGLIILVGFALLLEFTGFQRSRSEERQLFDNMENLLTLLLRSSTPEFLIRLGLRKQYGSHVSALEQVITPQRLVFRETDIRIQAIPHVDQNSVETIHQYEFSWNGGEILYAVVRDSLTMEAVLSSIENILEVTVVADPTISIEDFARLGACSRDGTPFSPNTRKRRQARTCSIETDDRADIQ